MQFDTIFDKTLLKELPLKSVVAEDCSFKASSKPNVMLYLTVKEHSGMYTGPILQMMLAMVRKSESCSIAASEGV